MGSEKINGYLKEVNEHVDTEWLVNKFKGNTISQLIRIIFPQAIRDQRIMFVHIVYREPKDNTTSLLTSLSNTFFTNPNVLNFWIKNE